MIYAGGRMILTADELGLFLRLCLARLGGEATFTLDSKEMETSDQLQLYVEGTDAGDGLTFVVHRVNESEAGHAD